MVWLHDDTDHGHTPGTIGADVAGIAMVLILLTANGWVRRRHYEIFYLLHTILIVVVLITGKSSSPDQRNTVGLPI
jgi:hypothetical protein